MCVQAQDDEVDYDGRYTALHRAYALDPHDEETLYNLTLFYFDNSNPMRSLTQAIEYARQTERRHVDQLERNRVRDLVQLQRKGITLNSIRDLKQAIHSAAYETVRLRSDLTMAEVDCYLEHFADNADLVRLLRSRRYKMVFDNLLARGSVADCHAFMLTYPGTAEAEQLGDRIGILATTAFDGATRCGEVDTLAAGFPQIAHVRRAADRRKAQLAFQDAERDGSMGAYQAFLSRYPASDESEEARHRIDRLLSLDLAKRNTAVELAQFADSNADLEVADQALARLRRLIYTQRDAAMAQYYVDHFKLDDYYSEVYSRYYSWHAVEGNSAPLTRFADANPDFPFPRALEDDLERAIDIDAAPLLDDYVETAYDRYASYVRGMMGKAIAIVPLQRMLQPLLASRRISDALFRMEQFEICFDNQWQSQYDELRRLLTAPAGRAARSLLADSLPVRNPAVNPADGCFYYSDGILLRRAVRRAGTWQPLDTVRFINSDATGLRLFGFYANGNRMLLGHGGDIWIAEYDSDGWRISDIPPYPVNTDYIETDACMLPDGSGLLLASDRPGGQNLQASGDNFHGDTALATDLWYIPYTNRRWGTPVNLGLKVNTPYCERHPVISRNLRTLYFVSDGNTGLGYGDIYKAERSDPSDWSSWDSPVNLGREVNSAFREADLSLSPDERTLCFSSNASGRWEAYGVATTHDTTGVGSVYSLNVADLSTSLVRLYVADVDRQSVTQVVDCDGSTPALGVNLRRDSRYTLLADAGTSFIFATVVDPDLMNTYRLPAYTYEELVAMDRAMPLPVVSFSDDGAELLPVAQLQLEQLARFLVVHPDAVAELFVDVAGLDARRCYDLSLERCEALRDFLCQRGVASARILLSPYGNARKGMDGVSIRFR